MGVEIKRKELYVKVWETPLRQLAKEFGVSDQSVGKACLRANIPRPGRGYWAKRNAGKQPHKLPLPLRSPGESNTVYIGRYEGQRRTEEDIIAEIPEPPIYSESLEMMHERVVKMVGKVAYPQTKTKTHPIIQNFLTWDDARNREYAKTGYDWHKPHFDSPIEKRRLRVLNAVFLAARSYGYKPSMSTSQHAHANRDASIMVGTQNVEFELKAIAPRGRNEKAKRLEFTISGHNRDASSRYYWSDTKDSKIESHLEVILDELIMTGERNLRSRRQQHYEWQVKWRDELIEKRHQAALEKERLAREAIEQAKQAKIDKLLGEAHALHQAEIIRLYVKKVVTQHSGDDVQVNQWADWALQQADTLDPVLNSVFLTRAQE